MSTNPLRPNCPESASRTPNAEDRRILAIPDLNCESQRLTASAYSTVGSRPEASGAMPGVALAPRGGDEIDKEDGFAASTGKADAAERQVQTGQAELLGPSPQKLADRFSIVAVAQVTRSLRHLSPRPKQSFFALIVVGVMGTAAFLLFQPAESPDDLNAVGGAPLVEIPNQIERLSQGPLRATQSGDHSKMLTRTPLETASTATDGHDGRGEDLDLFHIPSLDSEEEEAVRATSSTDATVRSERTLVRRQPLPEPFEIKPARIASRPRTDRQASPSRIMVEPPLQAESQTPAAGVRPRPRYEETDPATFRDPPYDFPSLAGQRGRDVR